MDPDRLDQLSQQQLDAWAEQSWQLDDLPTDEVADDLLDVELQRLTSGGLDRAALLAEIADTEQTQRALQARQQLAAGDAVAALAVRRR